MAGKLVEEVKFLHAGVDREVLRRFGDILETQLKLTGQADHGMKCTRGIDAFLRELQSIKDRQDTTQGDERCVQRAVIIYSNKFFQLMNTKPGVARRVAALLRDCLFQGYIAELSIDEASQQKISAFFNQSGVQRPPNAKPIDSSNYITGMDHGALTEAIYKQWFGQAAKLSDPFGGAEAMDIDDGEYGDYIPDAVRIIHIGLDKDDILKPLGRAFEDDVDISGQATYETYKKRSNKHPSKTIVKDMKNVRDERDEQAHGVLMWDANLMQVLHEKPEAKRDVEELLQQDADIPRQFANILMKDVELSHFQTYSPILYKTLAEPNRVVRLTNCLAKDKESINFQDLARAVNKIWIGAQSPLSNPRERHIDATNQMDHTASAPQVQMDESFTRSQQEPVESDDPTVSTSSLELAMEDISEPSKTPPMHSVEQYGPASSRGQSSEGSSDKISAQNHAMHNGSTASPEGNAAGNGYAPSRKGITTGANPSYVMVSGPIQQTTSLGMNSAGRIVASGGADSYTQEAAQKARHNERSLNSLQGSNEPRLASLDAKISEVGLSGQRPASLRGPSLQEGEPQQPIGQPQEHGNSNGKNRLAFSNVQHSVPMDEGGTPNLRNAETVNREQPWNQLRRSNGESLKLGHDSLPNEAAKKTSATQISATDRPSLAQVSSGTQTASDEEGRMMTADSWNQPRINNQGSLRLGTQSLQNQAISSSTQTTCTDDGRMPSTEPWNQPLNKKDGDVLLGRDSLGNQTADMTSPVVAQGDMSRGYHAPSGTYQKGIQFLQDPQHNMAIADGGADAFQRQDEIESSDRTELAVNNGLSNRHNNAPQAVDSHTKEPIRPVCGGNGSAINAEKKESGLYVAQVHSPCPSLAVDGHERPVQLINQVPGGEMAMASGNGEPFRREDERDNQDRINSQQVYSESDEMVDRMPADGQNQSINQQQQRQQQQQKQQRSKSQNGGSQRNEKDVGELRDDEDERPADAPPPYTADGESQSKSMGPVPHCIYKFKDLISDDGRSYSVPNDFAPNLNNSQQEGLFYLKNNGNLNILGLHRYGREPVASVSGSSNSDSNNESEQNGDEINRKLLKNLDQTCIKKMKIVLDPLKSIIADWRNLAGKYGVNNDTITYWRSRPVPDKGPTEHLLEHLATERPELTVDEFKKVLTHYKRFDVLEILKKQEKLGH